MARVSYDSVAWPSRDLRGAARERPRSGACERRLKKKKFKSKKKKSSFYLFIFKCLEL